MNIELQRTAQPEITEYPETELEMVRREIALEQSGIEPKLAIEYMLIAKFGLDYRYEDLTDMQRNTVSDTALEAFSQHIEHPNHRINDSLLRAQVLLLWAKVGNQNTHTVADMFSIEASEIDAHALEGLRYICSEMPLIPEQRFRQIAPIMAGIRLQTAEALSDEASQSEPVLSSEATSGETTLEQVQTESVGSLVVAQEAEVVQADVSNGPAPHEDTKQKFNYRHHLVVPGTSPDHSRRKPVVNYTEDVVPLTPQQLASTDYQGILFRKIANHRILSPEEITELSKDIEAGLVAGHKLKHMDTSASDTEAALYNDLQTLTAIGEAAKDKLVRHSLRLVMRIAVYYKQRAEHLDFADLFNEGALGLMHAVEKFDYKKGFAITTYATPWIHQAIRVSIQKNERVIPLSVNMHAKIRNITKASKKYYEEFGAKANDTELAAYMDMPASEFAIIKQATSRAISLNTPVGEKEDDEIGNLLYDEQDPATDRLALENALPSGEVLSATIAKYVGDIKQRPDIARSLLLYCGLPLHPNVIDQAFIKQHAITPGTHYSMEAIGAMHGVTWQTVQSWMKTARKTLTQPHIANLLRDTIGE